jgi:NO-binding membrane sensor protein with MHYT domain
MAESLQLPAGPLRIIHPQWDYTLVLASVTISLLGAFTSTQLMCQARTSRYFSGVLFWTILGSLIFGFCSIWSLHFVATLACGLDLQIGLNVPRTILSAFLAVGFTFCALGGELIRKSYRRRQRKRKHSRRHSRSAYATRDTSEADHLLRTSEDQHNGNSDTNNANPRFTQQSPVESPFEDTPSPPIPRRPFLIPHQAYHFPGVESAISPSEPEPPAQEADEDPGSDNDSTVPRSSENSSSERSSSFTGSSSTISQLGMGKFTSIRTRRQTPRTESNAFIATARTLSNGLTIRNLAEAFVWSMALTGMHYVGIYALEIPDGYITLNPWLVALSVFVGFAVCVIGCVLFGKMETNLGQQILFSVVSAVGVAIKHFTGMAATTFHTAESPTERRGYPPGLAAAIVAVAVITCIVANGLLAHSATVSRDKLAEVFHTRKKMWQAIAQKESAESAAQARSDFIASASHEIRTPLHQLQGYSDLLGRTELTEEGRLLLYAIQHATKTLSLITTNVLDWSRLEKHGDTKACQLVALDMRQVCEAVINLLPNKDEDNEAEILVVVAPAVPHSLFIVCGVILLMSFYVHVTARLS